jgi:hypothetical protein
VKGIAKADQKRVHRASGCLGNRFCENHRRSVSIMSAKYGEVYLGIQAESQDDFRSYMSRTVLPNTFRDFDQNSTMRSMRPGNLLELSVANSLLGNLSQWKSQNRFDKPSSQIAQDNPDEDQLKRVLDLDFFAPKEMPHFSPCSVELGSIILEKKPVERIPKKNLTPSSTTNVLHGTPGSSIDD